MPCVGKYVKLGAAFTSVDTWRPMMVISAFECRTIESSVYPTGVSKGFITEDMLAICDLHGQQVAGTMRISSEIRMHLEIYKLRPDIYSVVHAHPPTATGFAVAGIELTQCVLPEVIVSLGGVPLADYGTAPGGPILLNQ